MTAGFREVLSVDTADHLKLSCLTPGTIGISLRCENGLVKAGRYVRIRIPFGPSRNRGDMKPRGQIIIRWPAMHRTATDLHGVSIRVAPVHRWAVYLIAIVLTLTGLIFTAFFLSIVLGVFLIAGSAFGIWVWWMRRKLHQSAHAHHSEILEGEYVVVQEVRSADAETDRAANR